jgi:hypothetical protein
VGVAGHYTTELERIFHNRSLSTMQIHGHAWKAEGRTIPLDWALNALIVIDREGDEDLYDRAAVRWIARLADEKRVDLHDLEQALSALRELPDSDDARRKLEELAARPARRWST